MRIGLEISGHAGFSQKGEDLACAAVSVLSFTAANALSALVKDRALVETQAGHMRLMVAADASLSVKEKADCVFKTVVAGLEGVQKKYEAYVTLRETSNLPMELPQNQMVESAVYPIVSDSAIRTKVKVFTHLGYHSGIFIANAKGKKIQDNIYNESVQTLVETAKMALKAYAEPQDEWIQHPASIHVLFKPRTHLKTQDQISCTVETLAIGFKSIEMLYHSYIRVDYEEV